MSKIDYTNKVALNVDPSIADINKVKDSDMNSIKNAINQNGSYTPLTLNSNTGVFYCTLEGTLAANDIVHLKMPTTTGNVSTSISVDGDTTSYTILDEAGKNVKPVDISNQNIDLYFNGTNFILRIPEVIDVSSDFTSQYTIGSLKALYYPKQKALLLSFYVSGLPTSSSGNPLTMLSTTNYKPSSNTYAIGYGTAAATAYYGALTAGTISRVSGAVSSIGGTIMYPVA